MEAEVFQQHDITGLQSGAGRLNRRADTVVEKPHRAVEQFGQLHRHRAERILGHLLPVGPAEMRHQHHGRTLLQGVADGGQGRHDALVVGDGAGGLVLRDIEVHAHEDAFAVQSEVADGFELGHGK